MKLWKIASLAVVGLQALATSASAQKASLSDVATAEIKEIRQQLRELTAVGGYWGDLPRGAVIAFNAKQCPRAWHPYALAAGRVIVGTGSGPGLTTRALNDVGGAETHLLTEQEMPAHKHGGNVSKSGHSYEHHKDGSGRLPGERWQDSTDMTGGNKPHNNMPPYVSLLYCEKE